MSSAYNAGAYMTRPASRRYTVPMGESYCFAGNPLHPVSQSRPDSGWVASLLDDPDTLVLPLHGLKPQIRHSSAATLDWQNVGAWRSLIAGGNTLILLGIRERRAYFALDATSAALHDGDSVAMDARAAAPMIAGGEAAILAEARSLIDWHRRHRSCA